MGEKLDQLQTQYGEKLSQKEELRKKSEDMELKLDRAGKLVSGLAGERVRWEKTVEVHAHTHIHTRTLVETGKYYRLCIFAQMQSLEKDMGYLLGDCLLAAAFLSYMGPFLSNYRDELLRSIWIKQVTLIFQIRLTIFKFFTLFLYFCCSIYTYSSLVILALDL